MNNDNSSTKSLAEATRSRAKFSGHRHAMGAAGIRMASHDPENCEFLSEPGQSIAVSPSADEFEQMCISVEWDNIRSQKSGFFGKLLNKILKIGVDLDLGCLYEMQDGTRGAMQAFGGKYGALNTPPFIQLSEDERTGEKEGHDEFIIVNGTHWPDIKRILIYIYIYDGALRWSDVQPKVFLDIPGENDLVVRLQNHNDTLPLCVVGEIENIRNGIKLTNRTEFFPGHHEMDRAYGFGLNWTDGSKEL